MSHYAFSLERAREAATMVSTLEDRLSRNPGDFALRVSLASAVRMAEQMERELYEVAAVEQVDICRYRLVRHTGPGFALQGVSQSLAAFQDAVSYVLDAITGKPRQRAGLSRDIMRESELLFGWSFAGSLGVVLLAPSERRLFDTRFDDVVRTLTEAFDTDDNDELRDVARKIGRAALTKIYDWAAVNAAAGYDLDLRWTNNNAIEMGRYVEATQFGKLANLISLTSEVEHTPIHTEGVLVGFDSVFTSFHLVEPDGESFKGALADEFPKNRDWVINKSYRASIIRDDTTKFSTGETSTKYRLVELQPVKE